MVDQELSKKLKADGADAPAGPIDVEAREPDEKESLIEKFLAGLEKLNAWSRWPSRFASLVFLILGLGIWEYLSRNGTFPTIILPPPTAIITAAHSLLTSQFLYPHLWDSVSASVYGFFIGSALAFVLGIPLGISEFLRRVFSPFVIAFTSIPKVTLAPVFIVWLGFDIKAKVVMAALICFFPVFVNTIAGLAYLDPKGLNMMRSLGASRLRILTKLALPAALPSMFAGLRTATTLAVIGVVVSEFVGSASGLGYLLALNSFQLKTATVYVLIALYALLGWALFSIVDVVGRKVVFWQAGTEEWKSERAEN